MKKIIPLILLCMGCATTDLPPAEPSKTMMDQADRIILVTDKEPKEAYRGLGQYLSDEGFSLESTDPELLNIQTSYRSYGIVQGEGLNGFTIRVNASIRDSAIHFYGQTGNQILGEFEIENRGGKNNSYQKAWQKLVEIAGNYPHKEIYYSRN